jgi:hypothetical protein
MRRNTELSLLVIIGTAVAIATVVNALIMVLR